jgi:hypothetical protein
MENQEKKPGFIIATFETYVTLRIPTEVGERRKVLRTVNKAVVGVEEWPMEKAIPAHLNEVAGHLHAHHQVRVRVGVTEQGRLILLGAA